MRRVADSVMLSIKLNNNCSNNSGDPNRRPRTREAYNAKVQEVKEQKKRSACREQERNRTTSASHSIVASLWVCVSF